MNGKRDIKGMEVIKKILKKYKNLVNSIVERMLEKKQQSKMCKKCCYMALANVSCMPFSKHICACTHIFPHLNIY